MNFWNLCRPKNTLIKKKLIKKYEECNKYKEINNISQKIEITKKQH